LDPSWRAAPERTPPITPPALSRNATGNDFAWDDAAAKSFVRFFAKTSDLTRMTLGDQLPDTTTLWVLARPTVTKRMAAWSWRGGAPREKSYLLMDIERSLK